MGKHGSEKGQEAKDHTSIGSEHVSDGGAQLDSASLVDENGQNGEADASAEVQGSVQEAEGPIDEAVQTTDDGVVVFGNGRFHPLQICHIIHNRRFNPKPVR